MKVVPDPAPAGLLRRPEWDGCANAFRICCVSKRRKTVSSISPLSWEKKTVPASKIRHAVLRDGMRPNELRDDAFRRIIVSIPPGKVSTYGKVAAAAGYPLYHRAVARLLRTDTPDSLPWHRVLGAGGQIKLKQDAAIEQRRRLQMEGVRFQNDRVDMKRYEHKLRSWETL